MATNINDLYNLSQYIIRKTRGAFQTIPEFNQNIWLGYKNAVSEWFKSYGSNQQVHDALRPMRVYQPFTSDSSGFVIFPSDYMHLLGAINTVYGSSVCRPTWVNEDELGFALTSQLRPTNMENPIVVDYAITVSGVRVGGFSLYPQQTQQGFYFYLRLPTQPVLVVTQVGRDITYDPINSVQIETSEIFWNYILAKSISILGENMSEKEVVDYSVMMAAESKTD